MKLSIKKPGQLVAKKPHVYCTNYLPLVESSAMMIFSPGGVGKSFAAIREAVEFVKETGRKAALWLTEDPEGENRDRYNRIVNCYKAHSKEFFDSRISFVTDEPVKFTKMQDGNAVLTDEFWHVRLALFDYDLVIIDPLLQFQGCDENSNTHAGVFMGAMKEWAAQERKCLLMLHHASKQQDKEGKTIGYRPRGAGEWVNGTRGAYEVRAVRNGKEIDETKKDFRLFLLYKDNGVSYYFRDEEGNAARILPVFPERIEEKPLKSHLVRFSLANHNSEKNPKGFEPMTAPFDDLHNYVRNGFCYSPYQFANGHRLSENNLGFADMLCLDFDNGKTLKEAERQFAGIQALVMTTKSHMKNGKGERFRVFVKLATPLTVGDGHNETMQAIFDHFGSVDPQTKDMARFFYASPKDALYFYTNSDKPFDWEPFYKEISRKKIFDRINKRERKVVRLESDNDLPKETTFTLKNGSTKDFATLRGTLSYGEKIQVQCRNGYGHNGGEGPERNAAAFIAKADNGNVFYRCSGAKCASEGTLWCAD